MVINRQKSERERKMVVHDNGSGVLDGILKKDLMSPFIVIWILKDCHFLSFSYYHFGVWFATKYYTFSTLKYFGYSFFP